MQQNSLILLDSYFNKSTSKPKGEPTHRICDGIFNCVEI